jgi:hypothetical protein
MIAQAGGDDPTIQAALVMPIADGLLEPRARLRLRSLAWALVGASAAAAVALVWGLEAALRSGGCGFFYGLLAFHLQRVDPDDGHLQAGLVGAVCGIRSLAAPLNLPDLGPALGALNADGLKGGSIAAGPWRDLLQEMADSWLPLWLPLVASALLLRLLVRGLPLLRP